MLKKALSFDKTHIAYDVQRNKTYWFLVFLHGAGGDLRAWDRERLLLHQSGISTLAIDLRGHGLSDRPQSHLFYSLDCFAQDVRAVLRREHIRKYILIGHCFGGMVSMTYQKLFPNQPKSYVFIDTTYKAPAILEHLDHLPFLKHAVNLILDNEELRTRHFSHIDYQPFIGTADVDLRRLASDIHHMTLKSWLLVYETIGDFDATEVIGTITRPALVIHGVEDTIFNKAMAEDLSNQLPHAKLDLIPHANHIIVVNNPEVLVSEIWHFLRRIERALHLRFRSDRHMLSRWLPRTRYARALESVDA